MKRSRSRPDDVLFIAALAAVLLGIELLLYTTGAYTGALQVWPFSALVAGGLLLYLVFVRGFSHYFFFGGILFELVGLIFIAGGLSGWTLREAWPLGMVAAGLAGIAGGIFRWRRFRARYAAPSAGFVVLGSVFALFSFRAITIGFGRFVAEWWPSLLIAGGVFLFGAYGFSARGDSSVRGQRPERGSGKQAGGERRSGRTRRPSGREGPQG
ncbi:MAG TPA: hypothetical protein VFL04_01605 [Rectinemataceae bacterium]|nr:hypothetical protein [Rectinemataceae bacterium]